MGRRSVLFFSGAKPVDEHLLNGLVVSHQNVANGVSGDQVADFLGKVLDMVAGTFERLSHENDLQTCLASDVLGILNVTNKNEIAEAVHFRVSAQHLDSRSEERRVGK